MVIEKRSEIMNLSLYTDGSYTKAINDKTSGSMVILHGEKPLMAQHYVSMKHMLVTMHNVGGELQACVCGMYAAAGLLSNGKKQEEAEGVITIYHDYKGISELIVGRPIWRPRQDGTKYYVLAVMEFKKKYPKIEIVYTKIKSHSGNKWNDVADAIANGIVPIECKDVMLPEVIQE